MGDTDRAPGDPELTAMFHAAGAGAPPPGFEVADVVRASKRATARRRSAIAGGAAAVLVVVGGVSVAVAATGSGGAATSSAAAPEAATDGSRGDAAVPPPAAAAPSAGSGAQTCANVQDAGLRTLLEDVLPQVRGATSAPTPMICKLGAGREVHLQVTDGSLSGLLSVVFTPPGEPVEDGQPVGWARAGAPTASGGYVTVTSTADADSGGIPFEDRLAATAAALAPHL